LDEDAHRLTKAYKFSTGGQAFPGELEPLRAPQHEKLLQRIFTSFCNFYNLFKVRGL